MNGNAIKKAVEALRSYGADHLADELLAVNSFDEAKERELFLAWADADCWLKYKDKVFLSGLFGDPDLNQAWVVWQACAKSRAEP